MKSALLGTMVLVAMVVTSAPALAQQPPYDGTVFTEPNIVTRNDPSTLRAVSFREMSWNDDYSYDCDGNFIDKKYFLFDAFYTRGDSIMFFVDEGYGEREDARWWANELGHIVGQMPRFLRDGVVAMTLHPDGDNWCAGKGEMTLETGDFDSEADAGTLEESMLHEVIHTSLDHRVLGGKAWKGAQRADGRSISTYGRDNPNSEDLAETFTVYYGLVRGRLSEEDTRIVMETIPARIEFLKKNFPLRKMGL